MKIYLCNLITGHLVTSRDATLDPVDQQPMISAGATTIAPPPAQAGFVRCFIGGEWLQVEDHRGETWYDNRTPVLIGQLGPVIEGLTAEPAPLTDEEKLAALRAERDRKLSACDFTQLSDAPFDSAGKAEWAAYRQTLRDLPETVADLDNIEWPVVPGEI
jgi:hypothetical protein